MTSFPSYDPTSDSIRLNGNAVILLNLLMKSKFGERFDPETMFHSGVSDLIDQLHEAAGLPKPEAGQCFERDDLILIAQQVFEQSVNVGWWSMAVDAKRIFLQRAAAPWVLSKEQLQLIIEDIDDQLFQQRRVIAAADSAGAPL